MLNAKLECHLVGPHALSHEVSAFIYIYILMGLLWLHFELVNIPKKTHTHNISKMRCWVNPT